MSYLQMCVRVRKQKSAEGFSFEIVKVLNGILVSGIFDFPYNIIASTSAMLYGIFFDKYILYTSYWKTHTIIQSLIDWWRSFGRQWRREEGKALRDHQVEDQWQALLFFIDLQLCITYYNILYMYSCTDLVLAKCYYDPPVDRWSMIMFT